MTMMSTASSGSKNGIETLVNKSFLILDQIQESYFPLLEKCIFAENSFDAENKSKISKLEFVIEQRIKYVEDNCNHLERILLKLSKSNSSSENLDVTVYSCRLTQLRAEQKRIMTAFKVIKHKRREKERVDREQEELLTRRFTASSCDNFDQSKSKYNANFVIDLDDDDDCSSTTDKRYKKKLPSNTNNNLNNNIHNHNHNHSNNGCNGKPNAATVLSNKLRNQKPLVKRVRTRYLDFSTDFFGMTKVFFKYSCVDWILLFAFSLVILMAIFCLIVWQTTPTQRYE